MFQNVLYQVSEYLCSSHEFDQVLSRANGGMHDREIHWYRGSHISTLSLFSFLGLRHFRIVGGTAIKKIDLLLFSG